MVDRSKCDVPGFNSAADYEVILYSVSPDSVPYWEHDFTCPFLCRAHGRANEEKATVHTTMHPEPVPAGTTRNYEGIYMYPYCNGDGAQGFTVYRPL